MRLKKHAVEPSWCSGNLSNPLVTNPGVDCSKDGFWQVVGEHPKHGEGKNRERSRDAKNYKQNLPYPPILFCRQNKDGREEKRKVAVRVSDDIFESIPSNDTSKDTIPQKGNDQPNWPQSRLPDALAFF